MGSHPLPFSVAVLGASTYAGATVASAVVLGRVTDSVIVPAFDRGVDAATIWAGVALVFGVVAVRAGGIVTRRYFAGLTQARTVRTLQARVADRYRRLPLAYHQTRPPGELLAHAEADVQAATDVLSMVPFSTAAILLVVIATLLLLWTDFFLAAIGLLVLPLLTFLNRVYGSKVEPPASRAQAKIGDVSAVVHESVDGALVVKTLGREASEVARLEAQAEGLRRARVEMGSLRAGFEPAFEALPNLGIVALVAVGSWRLSTGAISTGTLVQFVSLFQLLAFPLRLIGFVLSDLPRAVVGRDRLEGVFREPITLTPAAEGLDLPEGALGVSVRKLSFSFGGGRRVLDDLSVEVAANESVALVGSTGAGKTTLAQLLVRLADPDLGSIRLGGVDLRHLDAAELRGAASIVFQDSFLFATSVRDNITLGMDATDVEVHRAAGLAQAHNFISSLPQGYATVVGERGVTLSGGQRQRVALARALLRRPRLLVLDDATSSVDPTVEAAILSGLRREVATTLVVIAYRVSTISLADRVLFLEHGKIVADGPHQQLLSYPSYEAMVRAYERGAA